MMMKENQLRTHIYLLGETGVGKSRTLVTWIWQIIRKGYGVCVIDPTSTLYDSLVARLAQKGRRVWDKIVLIDPSHSQYCVGINPLFLQSGETAERRAAMLVGIITKIYQDDPLITARMVRMLKHAFWLLIEQGLTLIELQPILMNEDFRNRLLLNYPKHHALHRYFDFEFPTRKDRLGEWTQSSLNRVDNLTMDPSIRLIMGQTHPTVDFGQLMDEGAIILVNTSKGILDEQSSYLFGGFIMAEIQAAAQARAKRRYQDHNLFMLIVDEFQNYVTDDIETILSETRKYGLGAILSHQFMGQLGNNQKLLSAILGTVSNYVTMRIGREDAETLAKTIFSPPIDQIKHMRKVVHPTGIDWWPYQTEYEPQFRSLEEIWESGVRQLQLQNSREFWFKAKGPHPPKKYQSYFMPEVRPDADTRRLISELEYHSARRYGRQRVSVEKEIQRRTQRLFDETSNNDHTDQ